MYPFTAGLGTGSAAQPRLRAGVPLHRQCSLAPTCALCWVLLTAGLLGLLCLHSARLDFKPWVYRGVGRGKQTRTDKHVPVLEPWEDPEQQSVSIRCLSACFLMVQEQVNVFPLLSLLFFLTCLWFLNALADAIKTSVQATEAHESYLEK